MTTEQEIEQKLANLRGIGILINRLVEKDSKVLRGLIADLTTTGTSAGPPLHAQTVGVSFLPAVSIGPSGRGGYCQKGL